MAVESNNNVASVLITGSSTGIGEACAIELDRRGFRVFAGVRCEQDGQRLVQQTSSRLVPVLLDVTDANAIAQATQTITEATRDSGLAGLVNNAGITVAFPLEFLPLDELRRQLEVNLIGPVAVTQAMLPLLRAAQGRIVNMSSISGRVAAPYVGAYAASKHALEALSDSLRVELRHFGVTVSLVEPGDVDTPIWQKSREAANRLGDKMAEELSDRVSEEVKESYAADITAMRAATSSLAEKAMPVERVVRAVVHALCSRRPRTRYPVGAKTWAAILVLRFLPDGLRDRIVRQNLGMK
ncbi:MAG: short-chain dehydrogenase/reductase [Planctomycetaceae bacterium]|nr:short-chain dehydrogenase/reductase [Planctomycetaceae bacterium]